MKIHVDHVIVSAVVAAAALFMSPIAAAQAPPAAQPVMPPSLPVLHVVDLMTAPGTSVLKAQWKTMEAKIVEREPIAAAQPGYTTAYDISPHAGEAGFDDAAWPAITAEDLAVRRGGGYVSFIWYRVNLTIPERIGEFETAGRTAVLTLLVDDYGEIWVDGQMPRRAGYPSPATIQGFNMPNRVVLSDDVQPGDQFQIAVFGINGPISVAPANTVWFREARLEFYP
ncbi:MAG: hypothetical protein O2930_12070 [Acidobacteria bacterium]|nr:hypothetical protein [Acidobacteriota bacterium]